MRSWDDLDPWEVLGVSPGASTADIRRAWDRIEATLAPGSLAVYSILDAEEQAKMLRQARLAYQRLLRAAGSTNPIHLPPVETPATAAAAEPMTAPIQAALAPRRMSAPPIVAEIGTAREITGALLREVREAWGIPLDAVAKRTRIMASQLAAIEAEQFSALPARVYLRGFVMTYARELGLDPDHAWTCLERRWQKNGPIPRPDLPRI